ncbi:CPBP family intramembrane metalloprotease [Pyxidicoccus fallax]|uniref:CPBP family intramembrane metalloprotease n=1 Tax=Pyxidicoccus fallax TaxID=394095 RepID=A0A848LJ63_9BACT|nr:CPBP family intramembrane glutamic endopeptidase [Pyxidicoccus fallax]NMO17771.1 CPBP family intramembrane metalloprotease [Pyxidicoccus fallax]NPC78206.1 CPBP family intramembrane metalloprotease [Pyxidicoccus fallax]
MDSLPTLRRALHHPLTRLVFCIVLASVLTGLVRLLYLLLDLHWWASEVQQTLFMATGSALAALLTLVLVDGLLERKNLEQLGLRRRGALRELGWGTLLGAGQMALVVGVLALAGWYELVEGRPETVQDEVRGALWWAGIFAAAGFQEEVLFRGIGFRLLEEWLGSAAALVLSSAFFGLVHIGNPNATPFATLAIAVEAGVMLGGAYMLTRSLWFATGAHIAWNWVQGPFFGIAVSGTKQDSLLEGRLVGPEVWTGGAFGAEAGGVALLVGTAVGVLLVVAAARRGRWVPLLPRRVARQQPQPPPAPVT